MAEIVIEEKQKEEAVFLWRTLTKDERINALRFAFQEIFSVKANLEHFIHELDETFHEYQKSLKGAKPENILFDVPWVVPVILDTMTTFRATTTRKPNEFESQFKGWMMKHSSYANEIPAFIPYEGTMKELATKRVKSADRRQVIRTADLYVPFEGRGWIPRMLITGDFVKVSGFMLYPKHSLKTRFNDGMVTPSSLEKFRIPPGRDNPEWGGLGDGIYLENTNQAMALYKKFETAKQMIDTRDSYLELEKSLIQFTIDGIPKMDPATEIAMMDQNILIAISEYPYVGKENNSLAQAYQWMLRKDGEMVALYSLVDWVKKNLHLSHKAILAEESVSEMVQRMAAKKLVEQSIFEACKVGDKEDPIHCIKNGKMMPDSEVIKQTIIGMEWIKDQISSLSREIEVRRELKKRATQERIRLKEEKRLTDLQSWAIRVNFGRTELDKASERVKRESITLLKALPEERRKIIVEFLEGIRDKRREFAENRCQHFEMRYAYEEARTEKKKLEIMTRMIARFGRGSRPETETKQIPCNNCGFILACEHERLQARMLEMEAKGQEGVGKIYKILMNVFFRTAKSAESRTEISCQYCMRNWFEGMGSVDERGAEFTSEGGLAGVQIETHDETRVRDIFNTLQDLIIVDKPLPLRRMMDESVAEGYKLMVDYVDRNKAIVAGHEELKTLIGICTVVARFLYTITEMLALRDYDVEKVAVADECADKIVLDDVRIENFLESAINRTICQWFPKEFSISKKNKIDLRTLIIKIWNVFRSNYSLGKGAIHGKMDGTYYGFLEIARAKPDMGLDEMRKIISSASLGVPPTEEVAEAQARLATEVIRMLIDPSEKEAELQPGKEIDPVMEKAVQISMRKVDVRNTSPVVRLSTGRKEDVGKRFEYKYLKFYKPDVPGKLGKAFSPPGESTPREKKEGAKIEEKTEFQGEYVARLMSKLRKNLGNQFAGALDRIEAELRKPTPFGYVRRKFLVPEDAEYDLFSRILSYYENLRKILNAIRNYENVHMLVDSEDFMIAKKAIVAKTANKGAVMSEFAKGLTLIDENGELRDSYASSGASLKAKTIWVFQKWMYVCSETVAGEISAGVVMDHLHGIVSYVDLYDQTEEELESSDAKIRDKRMAAFEIRRKMTMEQKAQLGLLELNWVQEAEMLERVIQGEIVWEEGSWVDKGNDVPENTGMGDKEADFAEAIEEGYDEMKYNLEEAPDAED